mmetsp:Transcript_30075/g.69960  ORF Transcript_30075/g.69960 Transcript_30075/m.69960 type:complete len:213 (+) Transcript_30075:470-1108(+)
MAHDGHSACQGLCGAVHTAMRQETLHPLAPQNIFLVHEVLNAPPILGQSVGKPTLQVPRQSPQHAPMATIQCLGDPTNDTLEALDDSAKRNVNHWIQELVGEEPIQQISIQAPLQGRPSNLHSAINKQWQRKERPTEEFTSFRLAFHHPIGAGKDVKWVQCRVLFGQAVPKAHQCWHCKPRKVEERPPLGRDLLYVQLPPRRHHFLDRWRSS